MKKNAVLVSLLSCAALLFGGGGWLSAYSAPQGAETTQQTILVRGNVIDEAGEPVIGAAVIEKGTKNGTATDVHGAFSLSVRPGAVLEVSSIGYKTVEVKAAERLTVTLHTDATLLDEVVAVGYGRQKKVNLTGAVANVNVSKAIASRPITDVGKALQGAIPGLTVTNRIGGIGTESTIKLRGAIGSINAGSGTSPLILVDNVEVPSLNYVNPDDVESISVLKDAASASIYGTSAAWGVILITTRQGRQNDRVRVSYSNNFAWNTPTMMPKIASAYDNAVFMLKISERSGKNVAGAIGYNIDQEALQKIHQWDAKYGGMSQDELGEMQEGRDFEFRDGKTYFYRSFDSVDMFTKKWTPQQQHNVSIVGGSEKTTYNLGFGYLKQEGIMNFNTDNYERFTLNSNVTTRIRDWWKIRTNLMMTRSVNSQPYRFTSGQYDAWNYLMRWPRWYPYATYQGREFRSAVTDIKSGCREKVHDNYVRANLGTEINPIKNLSVNVDYTFVLLNTEQKRNGGTVMAYNMFATSPFDNYISIYGDTHNRVIQKSSYTTSHIFKAYATYETTFNDAHNLKVMTGFDAETREGLAHYSERRNLISQTLPEINLATGDQYSDGGYHNDFAAAGFFGRINYNYLGRYLVEFNARYDGSSKFPSGNKFAFFPSVSAGWRLSEESFMGWAKPVLSNFKIRGSWGTIGNQDVAANSFISTMKSGDSGWVVNDKDQLYLGAPSVVSSDLTWERVSTTDFGFDMRLFDDSFGVTFDWYQRVTSDMHCSGETLPNTFGASTPKINFGELTGTGFELTLDYTRQFTQDFGMTATVNLAHVSEEITKFNNSINGIYSYYEGKKLGEIWGYETDRLFQMDDFIEGRDEKGNVIYTPKEGIPSQRLFEKGNFKYGPGDVKYKDLNGDGEINYGKNTLEDHGDLKVIGNTLPDFEYSFSLGFNYRDIDFSALFQGVGRRDYWAYGAVGIPAGGASYSDSAFEHQMDYWTPEHTDAFYPRPADHSWTSNGRNFLTQTRYLCDMSYLRCKNLTVGYTFPRKWMNKMHFQSARIYLSAENVFESDHMDIPIDPESTDYKTGFGSGSWSFGRSYPFTRTLSFGIQAKF